MNIIEQVKMVQPASLGSASFKHRFGIKYAYLTGAMYRGIASKELVVAIGKENLLGFLGTGGMSLSQIEQSIQYIQTHLANGQAYGMNLLSKPNDLEHEMNLVSLYFRYNINIVEAAAFMRITPALVLYRVKGLYRNCNGHIECRHKIIAKLSRPEVAKAFMSPPPIEIVTTLLQDGLICQDQAAMSAQIPMSYDICVEADSGGHTDRGVASTIFPAIFYQKARIEETQQYPEPIHVGLAGGIGTPQAAAAAFMLGADFILTGSINQCTVEAGTSDTVKDLLQEINVQDTDYAPAGDMFEFGAKVQVLKKGVFFPARANKLYQLYMQYSSWSDIPVSVQKQIEEKYFGYTFDEVWQKVKEHYENKGDFDKIRIASKQDRHKMILVFKWYFAYSSALAFSGDKAKIVDYQVHTGSALGSFNQWVKGTDLENWRYRHVNKIALMLLKSTAEYITQYTKIISNNSKIEAKNYSNEAV